MRGTPEKSSPARHAHFAIAEDHNSCPSVTSRPKKPAPITPRRFTKFFTPRPRNAASSVRTSRKALRSITGSILNRRDKARRLKADDASVVSLPTIHENESAQPSRKRKYSASSASPSVTSFASSPTKAVGFLWSSQETEPKLQDCSKSRCAEEAETEVEDVLEDSSDEEESIIAPTRVPYRLTSASASILSTRLTGRRSAKETDKSCAWQDETANFVSSPEDLYECYSSAGHAILPFSVASCKTNSLIAMGDEEGGVRLIESAAADKEGFSKAFLTMQPHGNAILDLEFSDDDRFLATASGDQTSHIIDMSTQQSIFCLKGHNSSIKGVRYQPGAGNHIVATCSRDGSVKMWDLRAPTIDRPPWHIRGPGSIDEIPGRHKNLRYIPLANEFHDAHGSGFSRYLHKGGRQVPDSIRWDFSITSLSFLDISRSNMLVTACEAHAVVKLWDIRATYRALSGISCAVVPLSSTTEPAIHRQIRSYGFTSLALGGDGARLYAMCRDNTIYAYSTSHLILGNSNMRTLKPSIYNPQPREKPSIGPLYGFVHPRLRVATFYPKLAVRKASDGHTEMLAAGSSNDCAVLFPTNERYLTNSTRVTEDGETLSRVSGNPIKMYSNGTALTRAHGKEVTAVTWTGEGSLVTVSDDFTSRCWREHASVARDLRCKGELGGRRWMMGWAETDVPGYDSE